VNDDLNISKDMGCKNGEHSSADGVVVDGAESRNLSIFIAKEPF